MGVPRPQGWVAMATGCSLPWGRGEGSAAFAAAGSMLIRLVTTSWTAALITAMARSGDIGAECLSLRIHSECGNMTDACTSNLCKGLYDQLQSQDRMDRNA